MSITIKDCKFDYLIPPKDVFNVTHSEHYIRHGKGKGSVRTIFANQVYEEDEIQKLKEFEAMIIKENVTLPHDWTELETIKYMYTGKLELKKSMKVLKQHLEWRMQPDRGIVSEKAIQNIKDGIVYISGRDKQYRPIIIVNVHKIDPKKLEIKDFIDSLCFVLDVAKKFYFVPGKVENWVIFIEINNTGLWSIPTKYVKSIIDVTAANYTSCLDKLYILNPTSLLKNMWSIISSVIDSETAEKIKMLKKSDFPKLLERISADQLEQAYNGTLPSRDVYWPPVNTLNEPPYTQEVVTHEEVVPVIQHQASIKHNEESSKQMSFNPEISDTRNLSVRQSTDEHKLHHKASENLPNNAAIEPIDIERKDSNKMYISEDGQKVINKRSAEYQSSMKSSLPAEQEKIENFNSEAKNDQQPELDQAENGYEHTFGGSAYDRKRPDEEELKTEKQVYGSYEPQEELTGFEDNRNKSQKNTHVTFGGIEVNEVSRVYSGRFGPGNNEEGVTFENETVSGGFCGMCSNPSRKPQQEKADGCNIF